jgi:hypothetical protein
VRGELKQEGHECQPAVHVSVSRQTNLLSSSRSTSTLQTTRVISFSTIEEQHTNDAEQQSLKNGENTRTHRVALMHCINALLFIAKLAAASLSYAGFASEPRGEAAKARYHMLDAPMRAYLASYAAQNRQEMSLSSFSPIIPLQFR